MVTTGNDSSKTFVSMCVKSLCSKDIILTLYSIIQSIIEPSSLKDHQIYFLSESWSVHILYTRTHVYTHIHTLMRAGRHLNKLSYRHIMCFISLCTPLLSCFEVIKHTSPCFSCFPALTFIICPLLGFFITFLRSNIMVILLFLTFKSLDRHSKTSFCDSYGLVRQIMACFFLLFFQYKVFEVIAAIFPVKGSSVDKHTLLIREVRGYWTESEVI